MAGGSSIEFRQRNSHCTQHTVVQASESGLLPYDYVILRVGIAFIVRLLSQLDSHNRWTNLLKTGFYFQFHLQLAPTTTKKVVSSDRQQRINTHKKRKKQNNGKCT